MRPRRALLYMPGTDWRKIEKATTLAVDSICIDLEDGVALNRKQEGRETIVKALGELDFGRSEKLVRVNPTGSGLQQDDLAAIIPSKPQGIVLPKVNTAADIQAVTEKLNKFQGADAIYLIAIVETAQGIVNLKEISHASVRLSALIFGAEDFAGDIGAMRTPEAWEVFYARSAVVTHAAAANLPAIDMVSADFRDLEALEAEARQGAGMGFVGKQIIHPNQVPVTHKAFTPSESEVAAARELVEAFEQHQKEGTGAFAVDGKMVDMPMIRSAERVLARAGWGK
ncbi:MAG: CoA ester lyase [Chloroflexi bacterium]|nr:MAG: CoA ester lyase [Chloroflexota bacterium]MBL1193063.1 CoA ester lyase [Chloroflexota bacterium]NOH10356.1 CoA ester lyase [Chloroflexota bacterium]